MGYDPTGTVDWGGVIIGIVIVVVGVAVTAVSIAGENAIGIEAGVAVICTGAAMIDAAARETSMVIDLSVSIPFLVAYVKLGESFIIDFSANEVNSYHHLGGGVGANRGLSYSVGKPENYENPGDYSKGFWDANGGYGVGFDHCWGTNDPYNSATKASCISFSFPASAGFGVGYDYYSEPSRLFGW